MKPVVAVTGGSGLVGSWFVKEYAAAYTFVLLDLNDPTQPVDITNEKQVSEVFTRHMPQAVIHFAAYTDVNGSWKQTGDTQGVAYKVNVQGTHNICAAAEKVNAHCIHISTAYVFDGTKNGLYTEDDLTHPIEWYGETKLLAEKAVMRLPTPWTILRIDHPFRPDTFVKEDAVHKIISGLQAGTLYPQFDDHTFGPTYIPDFAKVLDWVIRTQTTGVFHATNGESWSDFAFAQEIAQRIGLNRDIVKAGSLEQYLQNSTRPYQKNTALSAKKLQAQLDFELKSFTACLAELQVPETASALKAQQ